jgi:hypothetical protein
MKVRSREPATWAVLLLGSLAIAGWSADGTAEHTARVETESLRVVIADNEAFGPVHRAGYNGAAELTLATPGAKNLFVPAVSGLNFLIVWKRELK